MKEKESQTKEESKEQPPGGMKMEWDLEVTEKKKQKSKIVLLPWIITSRLKANISNTYSVTVLNAFHGLSDLNSIVKTISIFKR